MISYEDIQKSPDDIKEFLSLLREYRILAIGLGNIVDSNSDTAKFYIKQIEEIEDKLVDLYLVKK